MPMIVPIHRGASAASSVPQSMVPPNGVYVAMAAAQMDREGRLFKPPSGGIEDKMNSVPESAQAPVRV